MEKDRTRDESVFEPARRASILTEKKVSSEQFIEAALKKRTFYELINCQEGFLTLQGYFTNAVMVMDRVTDAISNPAVGGGNAATDYMDLNKGILTDVSRPYYNNNTPVLQTPFSLGNSSGARAMMAQLGGTSKGLGTGPNANLLSADAGGPLYSNFMVEVDEFKFSKLLTSIVH